MRNSGSILATDRGYTDLALLGRWTNAEVYFGTRLKEKTIYEVVQERQIRANRGILADRFIRLTGPGAEEKCPCLRRPTVAWDVENNREIELHSNLLNFGSSASYRS